MRKKTEKKRLQNQSNRVRRLYNFIAPFYGWIHALLMPDSRWLTTAVQENPPGSLLEVGVGTGLRLAAFRGHKITGIDLSEKMLQKARRRASEEICLRKMDAAQLDFPDDLFDTVVMAHVLSVTPDPEAVLAEAFRVLKPGGRLIVQNYFMPFNKGADRLFLLGGIGRLFHLRTHFSLVSLSGLSRFQSVRETRFGPLGCFRLLGFQKPLQ